MPIDVSIIIVNYNCGAYLPKCLNSIYNETKDVEIEIIVVDNNSTDGSIEMIKKQHPKIRIIENEKNLGFGAANNVGAKIAQGSFLFLLNPDTILCNNAIGILYNRAYDLADTIGCCGGNLLDEMLRPANIGGHFPSLFQLFSDIGFRVLYPRYYQTKISLLSTVLQLPGNNQIDSVCGADLLIRKSVFDKMKGFDESYFLYFEDTDLCYRLKKAGYSNYIFPDAQIIHLESVSIADNRTEKLNLRKFTFFENGKQLFFKKTQGYLAVISVKLLTALYVFTRLIAHRGNVGLYAKMVWTALKMKTILHKNSTNEE